MQSAASPAPWQQWEKRDIDGYLVDRATGALPEMECTKQLVQLVAAEYQPGMRVLDVGCNAGHYLRGLRRIDQTLDYTGVDINPRSIASAREIFADDAHARFEVGDAQVSILGGETYDIVFCCNVILHLPDYRPILRNLLASTSAVCLVRTLLDERTTLSRRVLSHDFPEGAEPDDYYNMNTWATDVYIGFAQSEGWPTEIIDDEFEPSVIAAEFETVKQGDGVRVHGGKQADGSVIYNWAWTRHRR